jgi:hypothetical protein
MLMLLGPLLVGLTVLMIVWARPSPDGEPAPFLRSWAIGQAYVLAALASTIGGAAVTVASWPF